jgi:hypothetical protein
MNTEPKTYAELAGEFNALAEAFLKARSTAYAAANKKHLKRACSELEHLENRMAHTLTRRALIRNACATVDDALRLLGVSGWAIDNVSAVWTHFDDDDGAEMRHRVRVDFTDERTAECAQNALCTELLKRRYEVLMLSSEAASLTLLMRKIKA